MALLIEILLRDDKRYLRKNRNIDDATEVRFGPEARIEEFEKPHNQQPEHQSDRGTDRVDLEPHWTYRTLRDARRVKYTELLTNLPVL
jgi:hypothetical protein